MTQNGDTRSPGSRIIRDRAMAVLRETRSRIDPRLLSAMKEHLSSLMPQATEDASMVSPKILAPAVVTKVYPAKKLEDAPSVSSQQSSMEPVDRQKIAQIVLHYMKNREDGQKH